MSQWIDTFTSSIIIGKAVLKRPLSPTISFLPTQIEGCLFVAVYLWLSICVGAFLRRVQLQPHGLSPGCPIDARSKRHYLCANWRARLHLIWRPLSAMKAEADLRVAITPLASIVLLSDSSHLSCCYHTCCYHTPLISATGSYQR